MRRKESINQFGVGVFWTAVNAHPNHDDATTTSALHVAYTMINIYSYSYVYTYIYISTATATARRRGVTTGRHHSPTQSKAY
jgi:hypothetical protein